MSTPATGVAIEGKPSASLVALFGLLGFSSGLPFLLFSAVLFLRLTQNGAGLGVVAFFAWVSLLPTFKFAWAPLLDRIGILGFGAFWGRWRSWILLCQLGTVSSLAGLAWAAPDDNLGATALWAVLLAFWTTTLEAAADGWRVELAPTTESQAPLTSAALWGYRSAMVAAGSGAVVLADHGGWGVAYLAIAVAALTAFPVLAATPADPQASAGRMRALLMGVGVSIVVIGAGAVATALIGSVVLSAAASTGLNPKSNVTPGVLLLCALPFILMMAVIPKIRAMSPDAAPLRSATLGPYLYFFRTYGYAAIGILAFVSLYRMGDVLTLTLSKPLVSVTGYSLTQIGIADGIPALAANIIGVGIGGWVAARFDKMWSLSLGALFAALGNFGYVWLAHVPVSGAVLYVTTFADHFGNGLAAAVFVVYLSLLANPRYPACQYAFLSGFAFLLPRLLAGASAAIQREIGYDGFFVLSGVLSLAALPLLPLLRTRPVDVMLHIPRGIRAMTITKLTLAAQAAGFLLSLAASPAGAQTSKLEAAIAAANAVVEAAIKDGQIPGAEMVIAVDGKLLQDRAFGFAQLNDFNMRRLAAPRPLQTTTLFDLASVTKVMATTMAMMLLVDQGKVSIDAPVHMYLPDFRGPELDKITVRHLLTHTAGLVQWQPLYYNGQTKAEVYQTIRAMPLKWAVGEGYHYSDLSFMLLGYIAERVSGQPLDQFLDRALYQPLGLRSMTFLPKAKGFTDFAATESGNGYERHMIYGPNFGYGYAGDPASWNGWRQYVLNGEVDDGNAWYGNGGVAGHAGLFSTGADLRVLLDLLLNHGVHQDKRHIRAETVDLFLKPGAHLGWVQSQDLPPGSFSHTGFTGTYVLGVPEAKLAFVLLTNRQNMGANAEGYFPDVGPIQTAAMRPLLEALLPAK